MKKLLCLFALVILSQNVKAAEFVKPEYYSTRFEVESVRPMCPSTIPRGAVCMGIGSIVTLKAVIGCIDELVFTEIKANAERGHADIYVASVVRKHPMSDLVRCARANEVRKTINIQSNTIDVDVINLSIESI